MTRKVLLKKSPCKRKSEETKVILNMAKVI